MSLTVNSNSAALVALQNLNTTSAELEVTQNRVSSGLKVAAAKDNSAVYAIAQNSRGDLGALDAVSQGVSRASSILDVAISAGQSISDLLSQLKTTAVAASDSSLDATSRQSLNSDFQNVLQQIQSAVQNASFSGVNLLDGSAVNGLTVLTDAGAMNSMTIQSEDLTPGSASGLITVTGAEDLLTPANAQTALADITNSIQQVGNALARLGSASKRVDATQSFISKLEGALKGVVGNLVDADVATESASLQALQVKQQLGVKALSIANSQPQIILSLLGNG